MIAPKKDDLARLKKAYETALEKEHTVFTFDGNKLVTQYAKYLIEYAELTFKRK